MKRIKEIRKRLDEITIESRSLMNKVDAAKDEAALEEIRTAKTALDEERAKLEEELEKREAELNRPAEPQQPKSENESRSKDMFEIRKGNLEFRTDMTYSDGGKALAPEHFVNELIKEAEKEALLYARVKKVPVTGAGSLGLPYESADASDAAWTDEVPVSDISADSTWKFGKKSLAPTDLTKLIKISKKLLATSALPIEQLAREKLTSKIVAAFENAILNGTGVASAESSDHTQPLGLFVASNDGIPTSRDVESEATTSISAEDVINVYMALRPAYRKNAVWVLGTKALKEIMKLKGTDGQFIWKESLREGQPSTLLGLPVLESEYVPTGSGSGGAWASGDYSLLLGDLSHYQFAYWKNIELTIDNLTFAGKNQIGIYGHTLADGQPTLAAAFARLKQK